MVDCELFGLDAGMHHASTCCSTRPTRFCCSALLLRWTNALWPSAFVAALFAWHPLHVESVAWIAERKDVLSTFFALLALLAYTRFTEESKIRSPKSKVLLLLALLMFALGLMAKPMLVTLPFVMLLLDYWPLNRIRSSEFGIRNFMRLLFEKWPFLLLTAASCVVTFLAQHRGGAVASLKDVPLHYRLEKVPVTYADYLLKMVWPAHLAVFYPIHSPSRMQVAAATIAVLMISWLVWRVRRPCPYWLVGWLWFLGTLVPVIGLVQVGGAALADRYTYFRPSEFFWRWRWEFATARNGCGFPKPLSGQPPAWCSRPAWRSRTAS